jgi:hypothetical protein
MLISILIIDNIQTIKAIDHDNNQKTIIDDGALMVNDG